MIFLISQTGEQGPNARKEGKPSTIHIVNKSYRECQGGGRKVFEHEVVDVIKDFMCTVAGVEARI